MITSSSSALTERINNEVRDLNTSISGIQSDLDDLDGLAVKYVNSTANRIELRAGTTITNLADAAYGPGADETVAVNVRTAKSIATDIAIGIVRDTVTEANKSIAFAPGNTAASIGAGVTDSLAIGSGAIVNGSNAVAIGAGARISDLAENGVAIGVDATVNHANSVAIGANTVTDEADSVAVGNRTIGQVAAANITAGGSHAATTGQLHNTASSVSAILGGGASVGADGNVGGWSVTLGDTSYTNVADALTGIDSSVNGRIDNVIAAHNNDTQALDTKIEQEIADRTALIRSEARKDANGQVITDANGDAVTDIHIGGNSLRSSSVAVEVDGVIVTREELFAQDDAGNVIDINVNNGSKLLVDGDEVIGRTAVQGRIDAAKAELNQRIDGVESHIANLENAIYTRDRAITQTLNSHASAIEKLQRGIAMSAALQTPAIAPGKTRAVKFGMAYYDGNTGLAGGYAERLSEQVSVNAEMSTSHKFEEVIVRGGINYSW